MPYLLVLVLEEKRYTWDLNSSKKTSLFKPMYWLLVAVPLVSWLQLQQHGTAQGSYLSNSVTT